MKTKFKLIHFLFLTGIICCLLILFESCTQKGCTDKNAINYNITANKDDKSCFYCDSSYSQTGLDSVDLIDNNTTSIHYLDTILRFYLVQKSVDFNDGFCGIDHCPIFYSVKNLLNEYVDLKFYLHISSPIYFQLYNIDIFLTPNQHFEPNEIPANIISNACGSLADANKSVEHIGLILYN